MKTSDEKAETLSPEAPNPSALGNGNQRARSQWPDPPGSGPLPAAKASLGGEGLGWVRDGQVVGLGHLGL